MSESKPKRVFLSFTGFHDPFFKSPTDGEERVGPVLNLIAGMQFDVAIIIGTPNTDERTKEAIEAIKERHPDIEAIHQHIDLADPSDYFEVLPGLRSVLRDVREQFADCQYFIGTASGTPQMHTCWVMLAASGEFPARLLQSRPPRFVTEDKPPITEIDPTNSQFPIIRPNIWGEPQKDSDESQDDKELVKKLKIVGDHPKLVEALEQACLVGRSHHPALILGESGTGKEQVAKLVRLVSDRADGPFVSINCSTIPENLAESTLFGHKKGSFTDAQEDRQGKFKDADGGTIFLDELGELPESVQAKLLRTIEQGEIEPVGGETDKVDVRVIAATNRKLSADFQEGGFRQDLYFRLNVGEIRLPSLSERRADISKLALYFLDRECQTLKTSKSLSVEAIQKLEAYSWPGNVRELENAIERAVMSSRGASEIKPEHILIKVETEESALQHLPVPQPGFKLKDFISKVRDRLYGHALELSGGSQTRAKDLLGVSNESISKYKRNKAKGNDSTEVD